MADAKTAREVHQLRDCVVRCREGDATGYGIFESMVIGAHPASPARPHFYDARTPPLLSRTAPPACPIPPSCPGQDVCLIPAISSRHLAGLKTRTGPSGSTELRSNIASP